MKGARTPPFRKERERMGHPREIVFVKWLGPHAEYDKIDLKTVKHGD